MVVVLLLAGESGVGCCERLLPLLFTAITPFENDRFLGRATSAVSTINRTRTMPESVMMLTQFVEDRCLPFVEEHNSRSITYLRTPAFGFRKKPASGELCKNWIR